MSNNIHKPLIHQRTTFSLLVDKTDEARRVLASRPSGVLGEGTTVSDKYMVKKANIRGIIFPWMPAYEIWWTITAVGAIFTVFFGPFQIAFQDEPGTFNDAASAIEWGLNLVFWVDIIVNFNLAFYRNNEVMVYDRYDIFIHYVSGMFWVDLVGVFPFENVALMLAGDLGNSNKEALLFSLLRLIRFVRLHRMKKLSDVLQYNARVSLVWFTLIRNFASVLCSTHLAACSMYFLARYNDFDENTWLGPAVENMSGLERYVTALYWAIVTFCTVGYGDFAPANSAEMIVGIFFMLLNIVVAAWIIGSITLLVVKGDEKTGEYRDNLETLHQYSEMHSFDKHLTDSLKAQLRLEHHNREIADEQVLKNFPSAVRRKVLRTLYLKPLVKTQLMKGVRQQFVDAFLASCKVEIFNPGEVIVDRGSILSDLFLLVGGLAEVCSPDFGAATGAADDDTSSVERRGSEYDVDEHLNHRQLEAGDFIGEIGFFTESPQVDSVACLTVCKTLTISQSAYKLLAQDHPSSVGKILKNLFEKVSDMQLNIPKPLSVLRAGSTFDMEQGYGSLSAHAVPDIYEEIERRKDALTAIKDLVQMHISKQRDDQTTRFCFAASRGDTSTISLMCDQGFDPNNADYDNRNALMVAAMKGNDEVVQMLLEYKASPNLTDMHGTTALMEAVKNGHEKTVTLLQKYGAELCMKEELAASVLCQAVFDGDILLLKRLVRTGIQINAADYDKRTAAHIAAAEGNVAAIRLLADHGADLTLEDRWGNTVQQEAERSNTRQLVAYLKSRKGA
mmetsp:Transcript_35225/g.76426  ORF Transcript_35225/g.76426 Transcript_35225/m.76426 type:complete len:788 (+) Transcript_35225:224-2587(+)